jgi:hypothetical protein
MHFLEALVMLTEGKSLDARHRMITSQPTSTPDQLRPRELEANDELRGV